MVEVESQVAFSRIKNYLGVATENMVVVYNCHALSKLTSKDFAHNIRPKSSAWQTLPREGQLLRMALTIQKEHEKSQMSPQTWSQTPPPPLHSLPEGGFSENVTSKVRIPLKFVLTSVQHLSWMLYSTVCWSRNFASMQDRGYLPTVRNSVWSNMIIGFVTESASPGLAMVGL